MGICLEMPSAMLGIKTQRGGSMELSRFFLEYADVFLSQFAGGRVWTRSALFHNSE